MSENAEAVPAAPSTDAPDPELTDESTAQPAAATAATDASQNGERAQAGLRELELEGEYAADYLEGLLDILDLDGDLDMDVEGERAAVAIVGEGLDGLVGRRGETLEALQELTRLAVQQRSGNRSRLMLDVGGFRARRRAELQQIGRDAAQRVADHGEAERLSPMTPFERKVVHDVIAEMSGVRSESEGEEPQRRVVVLPA